LKRTTWQAAFEKVDIENLKGWTLEEREDYAMSCIIGPSLGKNCAEFIVDYPPERAALAKIRHGFARRFELYVNGVEICNGYEELANAEEQRERFLKDAQKRSEMGKPVPKIDDNFLKALEKGMPECCGVALGLDRLYMLALGKNSLEDVLLFADGEA
jgi:lysyl-tRNA synthetase class 2